ncbi:MAG: hypothetical protein AB8B69_13305 [Chitinophagales bacterium]
MNKFLVFAAFLFVSGSLLGQISMSDSTAQVIGYWNKSDIQSFKVSDEKYKINGEDTTSTQLITYDVDISIKDSTENSYVVEWLYKNYAIKTEVPLLKKMISLAENISVLIKTDELGTVQEVVNWEEVRDYIQDATDKLKEEMKDFPIKNLDQMLAQSMNIYSSKESVEANAIKDAQQFYTFHGMKYKLGEELIGQLQLMNNYGGEPFDADITVVLNEINEKDDFITMNLYQNVDSEQLTNATYEYMKGLDMFRAILPPKEEFSPFTNETWTTSLIHGSSGWVLYSIETKKIVAEGQINVEERIIEMK